MGFLALLKTKLGKYLAGALGFLAVLLGAYLKGRGDQKDKAKADVVDAILEINEDVKDVEKVIRERPADANRERLRDKFASDPE